MLFDLCQALQFYFIGLRIGIKRQGWYKLEFSIIIIIIIIITAFITTPGNHASTHADTEIEPLFVDCSTVASTYSTRTGAQNNRTRTVLFLYSTAVQYVPAGTVQLNCNRIWKGSGRCSPPSPVFFE